MTDKILVMVMKPKNILLMWVAIFIALCVGFFALRTSFSADTKAEKANKEIAVYSLESKKTQDRLSSLDTVGANIETTLREIIGILDSQAIFIHRNQAGIDRLWKQKQDK